MNSRPDLRSSFRLAEWLIEPARNCISGPVGDAHVSPKSMEVLICLADHAGEVVNRDDFSTAVWGEAVVTDASLTCCISELRRAFGDSPASPGYIETISKRGYRLLVAPSPVCADEESVDTGSQAPPPGTPLAERQGVGKGGRRRTGKGDRRRSISYRTALLAALLVLTIGLALWYLPQSESPEFSEPRLAVLPFENLSPDPANAYFAGGLHDELLTQLSKIENLSLRGRTSVMKYAETTKSVRQIAEELNADALVEGSVQAADGRLRVNVQLIDAVSDEHLWAESYDHTVDDVFAIQSDIVERVVEAVGAQLKSEDARQLEEAPTKNPVAYRFYLQGREYLNRRGSPRHTLEAAQQLYERALELDPEFALAYAELSMVHALMHWLGYDSSPERMKQQRLAVETAMQLAPDLPQARLAMGMWHYFAQQDWQAAREQFEIAQRERPGDVGLIRWIANTDRRLGNWDKVLDAYKRIAELDPRNAGAIYDLGGSTYEFTGRYQEAMDAYAEALSLAPDFHVVAINKAWLHVYLRRDLSKVRETIEALPDDADIGVRGSLATVRAELLHWERDADGLLELMASTRPKILKNQRVFYPPSLYDAWAYQMLGDQPSAQASFETALSQLDDELEKRPDDWRVRTSRGYALAGLGRREEAVAEADWLAQLPFYRNDAYIGQVIGLIHARVLAQAGEADRALDEIERLLAGPSRLSINELRLDPFWDPIREHPRFVALVEEPDRD